jgi:hypothetical protein
MNNFQMPQIYLLPTGGPLYWRNEQTGVLTAAVFAYLNRDPTGDQLELVRKYLEYYIHAPCWNVVDSFEDELEELRRSSKTIKTYGEIHDWIFRALEIGIDPL